MTQVYVRSLVEWDLFEARKWYNDEDPQLGREFIDEFRRTVRRLREMPLQFPSVGRDVRRALLHRFPYAVYFLLQADQAIIIAVLHQRRRPAIWKRRSREE